MSSALLPLIRLACQRPRLSLLAVFALGSTLSAQQITLQPSPAAITAPEGYVFTLQAAGANNLSVRWYLNGAPAPGALSTENTYTATLSPSTAGNYTFRVIGGQSTVV